MQIRVTEILTVSVSTHGALTMVLLDENDKLIGNPYHYRDTRTEGMYDEAFKLVPKEEIFKETGIAFNWFNTIYQLLSAKLSGDTSLKMQKLCL